MFSSMMVRQLKYKEKKVLERNHKPLGAQIGVVELADN